MKKSDEALALAEKIANGKDDFMGLASNGEYWICIIWRTFGYYGFSELTAHKANFCRRDEANYRMPRM